MTNAGVRREAIGLPTNASFKAFLSGKSRRYLGDGVCMAEWWRQVDKCGQADDAMLVAELPEEITAWPLTQPINRPHV